MVVHDLAEAAAEGPVFGFDPGKEGIGEVVQGGVGGDFNAAVELDFLAGGVLTVRYVLSFAVLMEAINITRILAQAESRDLYSASFK